MAGIVQLYSNANSNYSVRVDARTPDGSLAVGAIVVSAHDGAGILLGQGEFKVAFTLPAQLVDGGRLRTWSEIQAEIKALRDAADVASAALMEQARDRLREALMDLSIDLNANAGAFLGIDGVGLAGASATARLTIDLVLLDPAIKPKPADDAVLLTAKLGATGTVDVAGNVCTAAMQVELFVTRGALINAMPSFSVDSLAAAKIPPFDFRWPKIDWPTLSWATLDLSRLASLLRFDLPIPKFGDVDQPLHVNWSTPPRIAFSIGANNRLAISTAQDGVGELVCDTKDAAGNPVVTQIADITGFRIALTAAGGLTVAGTIRAAAVPIDLPRKRIEQPDALPFTIESDPGKLTIAITTDIDLPHAATADITAVLDLPRILIRAKSDPALLLAFAATYEQTYHSATGASSGKLTRLAIVEPYPVALVAVAIGKAEDAAQALIRFLGTIHLPTPGVPDTGLLAVLERMGAMIGAAVSWLARQAGSAVDALLGVAEAVGNALQAMVRWLTDALGGVAAGGPRIAIEVRLDSRTFSLRQIVVSPVWDTAPATPFKGEALGLAISVPLDWRPSLVIDLDGPASVALIAVQGQAASAITLGTDLWLSRDAGVEAVRDTDTKGERPDERLIQISAKLTAAQAVSVFRFRAGKATFFESMSASVDEVVDGQLKIARITGPITYKKIDWSQVVVEGQVAHDAKDRLLPFLQSSKGDSGGSFLDSLGQYITVTVGDKQEGKDGTVALPLKAKLTVKGTTVDFPLTITLDLKTFDVRFKGPEVIEIKGTPATNGFDIFGLTGRILPKTYKQNDALPAEYGFYKLDFSKGDVRLALADTARLDLAYGKVASGGRGIVFRIDEFGMSRRGLDLAAKVDPETPVQLAGVDMPFRFDSGGLSIKSSEIQAFSIKGSGQLPPELVGEANATISISMGRGKDGSLIVQSAEATLDKSSDPIVCHGTRFTLTLSAIGFEFHDFSSDGAGYHFYFTLTGTAEFKPRAGEFTDGLLKNFGSLTITLDKAPLARDASMLLRAIEFQVSVEPKKRVNFFNLFTFELRGIGFHPASPAFGGKPAMSISGQVNFVEAGDIVSPRFDFHKLWIAPPKDGDWRPQVRFDGLTVGVRFGGAASIEGTAIAVDDKLPSLYKPGALPADVTAHGFLASGKLTIKGWGQMAASMGFLELQKQGGEVRQAFFLYAQEGELSIEIPTPLGSIYLREVGFGFGYRFTLAAFNRADKVHSVKELIQVLDDISKYQGELATVTAWEPEAEGNRLTLALRGLISISSASEETDYNADGEKDLPNPVLFDIVAALRSDLTFFLNARVWIARNYADWHDSSATADAWRTNPTLRGYVYLSVPRKEFLARMIADGTGDVEGKHPELPAPLVQAMKAIRWSATTYIRPGLFHQEFGWPYELGFTFERGSNFQIVCQGGLVNRIEDLSILYGIAFRAKGFAQIGGSIGGRSFGASVVARADFSIDAKFIAYLSIKRFNDTLFYGALAFDVSISLQVRVWLEFSVGFTDIHLEVGFSLSLTISIALEVAVSPNAIGGRAAASVGVGGFGRSIRLGIGVGFNEGALVTARSRVERFLSLGLTVATPDAEQGVAPPAPEQPRGPASRDADQAVDHALEKHDEVSGVAVPGVPAPAPQGRALEPSGYWAMLFPVAGEAAKGDDERFVMTFVPRDHSETGLDSSVLPRSTAGGKALGTFYAPPYAAGPNPDALEIVGVHLREAVTVTQLFPDGRSADHLFDDTLELKYDLDAVVFRNKDDVIKLGNFLAQCFVVRSKETTAAALGEPDAKPIQAGSERLPNAREAAAQRLADAGRDQVALGVEQRAANDIEERRSAAVAALCESAARLAAGGPESWKVAAPEGLDARGLGIAFVIKRKDISILFGPAADDKPRPANFDLRARDTVAVTPLPRGTSVHLFNSPERMFRTLGPKLAEPIVEATRSGIRLDWDLEPAFGRSTGVWDDPEFDLKHYRIERILTDMQGGTAPYPARRVTVKAAAPMRLVRDLGTGEFVWRFLRPNAQFVDDLSDLPSDVRAAILPPGSGQTTQSFGMVRYVIVPVDTAGTDGAPTPLQLVLAKPRKIRDGVRRAVLHFEYTGDNGQIPGIDARPAKPALKLGLDDGRDGPLPKDQQPDDRKTVEGERKYVLRVRKERSVPTGLYGGDAVTDALARPSAGDFAQKQVADEDFELTLPLNRSNATRNRIPLFEDPLLLADRDGYGFKRVEPGNGADLDAFFKAIGVDVPADIRIRDGALGVRFAIRPKESPAEAPAPWCPVDITMMIDPREDASAKLPPIAAPIEIFEHPVAVDAAPLLFDDLGGEAGRVLVWHPDQSGLLSKLLNPTPDDGALVLLRDGSRRVATRVRWNGRPAVDDDAYAGKSSSKRLARFFGGFDVFEIDAAGEVEGATSAPAAVAIAYKFSTKTADTDPGAGALRLNDVDQARATGIFLDLLDKSGRDRSDGLDLLDQSSEHIKGQVRLVKADDPSRWLAFDLSAAVKGKGYRKLMLACTDASGPRPFADNDGVVLLFTRLPARHIARMQALPGSMARLDPAEIADFAKVEAHYPSETRRLQKKASGRRAAWYSPAESFIAWPTQALRRSLSINVDESILTELLSNGRPTRFEASLKIGDKVYAVSRLGTGPSPFDSDPSRPWTARTLRALLQGLTWEHAAGEVDFKDNRDPLRSARVTIAARKIENGVLPGTLLASAEWQVDLNPALHPVLADAIDWARYQATPAAAYPALKLNDPLDTLVTPPTLADCTGVAFSLSAWPEPLPRPALGFRAGSETTFPAQITFPQTARTGEEKFKIVQSALGRMVTSLSARGRASLISDIDDARTPGKYDGVVLRMSCVTRAGDPPVADVSFRVDIRSMVEDLDASVYRRYEPVLEPLPKNGATDVAGWFNESPAERDPYGWGILRTLGLGVGLRLYDTETRDYATPRETLLRLQAALSTSLTWYADLDVGAPFVDVVTRAGGTMKLASFDGGTPGTDQDDVRSVLDHDALALTQMSLRPLPDRWQRTADGHIGPPPAKPVAYLAVRKHASVDALKIDMTLVNVVGGIAVADVRDLTAGLAKPPSVILSSPITETDEEQKKLRKALTDNAGAQSTLTIDVSRAAIGDVVVLVRATVTNGDAAAIFGDAWIDGGASRVVEEVVDPIHDGEPFVEPFGRFGDMAAERYGALARTHEGIRAANAVLRGYAVRRWPDGWPTAEAESALLARIPDWSRRFVDHGPGLKPSRDVHFSLAEVTRPDPWRVGVQDDGTMEVLFTHDDRKRRLKRYAVRPFGRYEGFVDALRAGKSDSAPRVPQLTGAWSDWLAGFDDAQKRFADSWSRRMLDIVIPRTEPLAPPVLVDAKRIEILPPGERDPKKSRRVLEFLYKRHAEEILSETSVTVEGALSFETVSVGFWREFGMERWAQDLVKGTEPPLPINTAEPFGNWDRPKPPALIESHDHFGGLAVVEGRDGAGRVAELPGRYADGWRGVLALRTEALPFFFRVHAAAFASAGVVVSEPVIATVEEGHYDLYLPWKQPLFGTTTPGPRWSVQRRVPQHGEVFEPGVYLAFGLPLVRLVDGMPLDTRPIWLSEEAVPEVFTLPDPAARYEIRAIAADSAGLSAASAELDVFGQQRAEADPNEPAKVPPQSGYGLNIVGPLFKGGTASTQHPHRCTNHRVWWQLEISAKVAQKDVLPAESFAPTIEGGVGSPLLLFELHPDAFANAAWRSMAPKNAATVTVTAVPTTNAGWTQFKADVRAWRDIYAPYAADPTGRQVLDFLQRWVDTDGNGPPPANLDVPDFVWGLPRLPDGRPAAVQIAVGAVEAWQKPDAAGIAEREMVAALEIGKAAAGYDQNKFDEGIRDPLRAEMRRLFIARKEYAMENRFLDFPPFAAPLPASLAAAARTAGLAREDGSRLMPDCVDVIASVAIEIDPRIDRARIVDLITAVEAAPFTALAIADLGALENGAASAVVHLPYGALARADVVAALTAVGAGDQNSWRAVSLLLRMPPEDEERDAIMKAISTVADETVRRDLLALADEAMAGQVFGPGRTPGLKVFRGAADPAEDAIVRAEGEASPCR
ncbi:hypothetical protein RAD15_08640 [Bradyrhizobium sp. 14AA]